MWSARIPHGGGSSVYAIGRPPGDARGWPVRLKHPSLPDESLGVVRLRDAGLGTSAATFQFFEYNGRKLGHLLDPRTGWPAAGTASASVTAPTAAEADAMSTAAFVLGAAGAERLTRLRPALGAVVLAELANPERQRRGASTHWVATAHPVADAPGSPEPLSFNLAPDVFSPPVHAD